MVNKKCIYIVAIILLCNTQSFAEGYFAKLSKSNVVTQVVVAKSMGECLRLYGGTWIETFIDAPDKNYAGKGHDYFEIYKDFVAPTPFVSWALNAKRKWKAPVDMPTDGKNYRWNESLVNWEVVAQ